jgi:hypothetical protein
LVRSGDIPTVNIGGSIRITEADLQAYVDTLALVASWGCVDRVGMISRFAKIDYPVNGLLVLGEVEFAHGFGDSILNDLRMTLQQRHLPPGWGFSVGGWQDPNTGEVVLREISLSRRQAYADAKVLAVGPEAIALFDMLTEKRPAGRP